MKPGENFKKTRLRFLFNTKSGATPVSSILDYWNGDIYWVTPEDLGSIDDKLIFDTRRKITTEGYKSCGTELASTGSLVLSKRAPIGQVAILGVDAACNQGCFLLTRKANLDERFFYYCLVYLRQNLEILGRGSTFMELSTDDLRSIFLPNPSFECQRRIADYLDAETAQIDALVAEKERMLALLEEKRAALISRAVTRGLNPDVPMKPSGLEWLGDIPAHWEVKRSKRVLKERDERSETGNEELLTVSHITGVTKRSEKDVNMFEAETTEGYKLCSPGNLVINTLWAWMGAMGVANESGIVSPAYHVYKLSSELLPGYVDALVRMSVFAKEVTRFSKGVWSSRLRLYPEGLYEVWLPVPPLKEQEEIVVAISREREKTADFESALKYSIALLKERRSALITAAVTGQLQIPNNQSSQ